LKTTVALRGTAEAKDMTNIPFLWLHVGGGGISAPISGQDFSNQDLRKRSFTKAIMRQTNFSNCNLTGVSFFGGLAVRYCCHSCLSCLNC
jgi:uncharacterized protein YjbI with pentapeptide repeats